MPSDRSRDEILFEALVRENERAVVAFLRTMVRDPGLVDDLFQETLLTAWRKFGEFDPARGLGPWLRGIAFNLVRNAARSRQRDCLVFIDAAKDTLQHEFALFDRDSEGLDERIQALKQCVEGLQKQSKRLVQMRYGSNMSAADIAAHDKSRPATVRKQLQRIRQALLECIQQRIRLAQHET